MYKASIELGKINKCMKLKFCLIIKDDQQNRFGNKLIDKFMYSGSEYLRISPKPFLTVDISGAKDKNDTWNANSQVNLNKFSLAMFIIRIKRMIDRFRIREMYYIQNNRLCINKDIANKNSEIVQTPNKAIKLLHTVIVDSDNNEVEYEGIVMMINSVDNFCYLTYDELNYLYYELTHINMDIMAMQLLNAYLLLDKKEKANAKEVRELKFDKDILEESANEETKVSPKLIEAHEIPDDL